MPEFPGYTTHDLYQRLSFSQILFAFGLTFNNKQNDQIKNSYYRYSALRNSWIAGCSAVYPKMASERGRVELEQPSGHGSSTKQLAPVYSISQREIVAVEHPMIVKSIDNALKTFGTNRPFRRVSSPLHITISLRILIS